MTTSFGIISRVMIPDIQQLIGSLVTCHGINKIWTPPCTSWNHGYHTMLYSVLKVRIKGKVETTILNFLMQWSMQRASMKQFRIIGTKVSLAMLCMLFGRNYKGCNPSSRRRLSLIMALSTRLKGLENS